MKTRKIITTLALLLFFFYHGIAQDPLQFNVIPMPPFSPRAGDYMDNPARFVQVTVTNNSRTTQLFYLSIKLEMLMPGTALVEVPHNMPPMQPISIGPFQTMMLTQMHYDQLLGHLSYNDLIRKGIDEQGYVDGTFNLLPEGLYQICFTALDFNAPFGQPKIISSQIGACANFNICYAAAAPILATPVNCNMQLPHDTIQPSNPFIIAWMPPAFNCTGAVANFNYNLRIVEVMPGQDLQTAIDYNPIALQLQNIMVATVPVDTNLYPGVFRRGERYAMQVTAEEGFGGENIFIENDGMSPICTFVWGSVPAPDDDIDDDPPPDDPDAEDPDEPLDPIIVIDDTSESTDPQCVAEVSQNTTPFEGTLNGQQVQIGLFNMQVTQANENNGMWTGTGKVDWNPQGTPLSVRVEFENIRINTDLKVFEGAVFSQQETALHDYIPEIIQKQIDWAQTQYNVADDLATQLNFNIPAQYNQKMQEYATYIGETSKLIHNLTGDINLPINLESMVPGTNIDIGIIGMVFTPHVARMNTFSAFRVPEALPGMDNAQWLAFLGHGMCFTPDIVVSTNEANLFLAQDFDINIGGGFRLTFKKSSILGDMSDGTFISWNNDGFDQAMISFDVQLPSSIRGENADGTPNDDRIAVSFEAWLSDWNDWIAEASVPPFQVRGLSGFSFAADRIVYDHSTKQNPDGITFPPDPDSQEDYDAGGNEWKGFWLDQLQVMLPVDFKSTDPANPRGSITLNQLLIDNQGFTFDILALDPLQSGVLGGCAFSIDTIAVNMYKSDFRLAKINGGITIPVTDSPLPYEGILSWDDNDEMDYLFYVKPTNDISMPAWIASLNIYESSGLEVVKDEHGAAVSFLLHGDISLDSEYAIDIPLVFSFSGIGFQNLGIANRSLTGEPEFYLSAGDWSQTSPQKSIGPFDVSIDTPSPYFSGNEFGLSIEAGFSIAGAFSCNTDFNVLGKLNWNVAEDMLPTEVGLESVRVEQVEISGDFGPVDIEGLLTFYYDDATFGNGMRGEVSAVFDPAISIQAVAQFGRVDDYTYWYVDAMANFSPTIPLVGPTVQLGGFGGGVYYNMTRSADPEYPEEPVDEIIPDMDDLNATASGVVYLPQQDSWGFKAAITLAISDPNVMNGSLSLECAFSKGRFSSITITGDAYMLTNYPENSDQLAEVNLIINYDREENLLAFSASAHVEFLMSSVTIPIDFEAHGSQWYLMVGDPHGDRVEATLFDFDAGIIKAKLTANCYFALGNNLPNTNLPMPPDKIVQFLNLANLDQHRGSLANIPEKGMMFGAGIHGVLDINLIVYAYLEAIAGFDVTLLYYEDAECNNEPMGFYGWYGMGQVYGYFEGDVGIKIDVWFFKGSVSLMKLTAGAFLRGGMPNPFWAKGKARVTGSILGGRIRIRTSLTMDIGEECLPPVGDPLADIQILEEMQPGYETFSESASAEPVSVFSIPRVTANVELSDDVYLFPFLIEIPPSQENEHGEIREYKFTIEYVRLYQHVSDELPEYPATGGIDLPFHIGDVNNRTQIVVNPDLFGGFQPHTHYAFRTVARAWQRIYDANNQANWQDPLVDGEPVENVEVLDSYFHTGDLPNNFDGRVLASYPLDRQRYFLRDEDFTVVTYGQMAYLWQNLEEERVEAYLTKHNDDPANPSFTPHRFRQSTWYSQSAITYTNTAKDLLQPEEIYNFSIIRINRQGELDFLAQMAEERRRLVIKSMANNLITNTIINAGGLSFDDFNEIGNNLQPISPSPTWPPDDDFAPVSPLSPIIPGFPGTTGEQDSGVLPGQGVMADGPQQPGQPAFLPTQPIGLPGGQTPVLPDQPSGLPGFGGHPGFLGPGQPNELLEMLTLEEYEALYKADTLDYRQQVLLGQFEVDYIDTLFTVTFATSQHRNLRDKIYAFGSIMNEGLRLAYSEFEAEPFEVYDLVGYTGTWSSIYIATLPPLLQFYQPYHAQHPRDHYWGNMFHYRAHLLNQHSGGHPPATNWRPRSDAPIVPHPRQMEVHFGESAKHRRVPLFPLSKYGFSWLEYDKLYPGRHDDLVFHGADFDPFNMPGVLSHYELSTNQFVNIVKPPEKLSYWHSPTRRQVTDDLFAMRLFSNKLKELAEDFESTSGSGRENRTKEWIRNNEWISGSGMHTQIWMPKYQVAWFYTLKTTQNNHLPWNMAKTTTINNSPNWSNHSKVLQVKVLNFLDSQYNPDGSIWNYDTRDDIIIHLNENLPVLNP